MGEPVFEKYIIFITVFIKTRPPATCLKYIVIHLKISFIAVKIVHILLHILLFAISSLLGPIAFTSQSPKQNLIAKCSLVSGQNMFPLYCSYELVSDKTYWLYH